MTMTTASKAAEQLAKPDREEGELSTSDDDGQPDCSVGTVAPPTGRHVYVAPASKSALGSRRGNAVSSNNSTDIQTLPLMRPSSHNKIDSAQAPSTSANPGKYGPVATTRNLVISFSDDDSEGDSGLQGREREPKVKSNTNCMPGNGKPPASLLSKSKVIRRSSGTISKAVPKNSSFARTFTSAAYSRIAEPVSTDQQSQLRNSSALKRNIRKEEQRSDQILGSRDHKLQDLRQQIALRESELRLRAAQQNKDTINPNVGASNNCNVVSGNVAVSEPKEPDKKRLKVRASCFTQPVLDGRPRISAARSALPSKEPLLEKGRRQELDHGADFNNNCNQPGRNNSQVDPHVMSQQTMPQRNMPSNTLQNNIRDAELNHRCDVRCNQPNSALNENAREQALRMNSGSHEAIVSDQSLKPFNGDDQPSLYNTILSNFLESTSISGHSRMDIQALVESEESLDKELEEAQEHRHMSEIEERNALKAYRKAQRSLIKANAKCAALYRKRELLSDRIKSFMIDDPSLLWSSGLHGPTGNALGISNNMTENIDIVTKSHQIQLNCGDFGHQEYDRNVVCANSGPHDVPHPRGGQNLGSEPCSDPDASTSELLPRNRRHAVHRLSSPTSPNLSLDEDVETLPMEHEYIQRNFKAQRKKETTEGTQRGTDNLPNKNMSVGGVQDSLLLEATLRSELFARLGMRTALKDGGSSYNAEAMIDRRADSDVVSEKTQMSYDSRPSSEMAKNQHSNFGGTSRLEGNASEVPTESEEQCAIEETSLKVHPTADSESNKFSPGSDFSSMCLAFSAPIFLRSAFGHFKTSIPPLNAVEAENRLQSKPYCFHNGEIQWTDLLATSTCEREIGSYTCDFEVDPSWPLCMYELRGRCNNDECPWQHFKDFSNENMHKNQHDNFDTADSQPGLTLHRKKCEGATRSLFCSVLASPTYLVCLDTMKFDSHAYESVVTKRHGQCWCKCFSMSLASSSLLQKDLSADERLLHGNEGRIEVHGSWRTESSYFRSKNNMMNQLKQSLDGVAGQPLENALLIFNQEVNQLEGLKKALAMLSRCLEVDPTSESVWIVYLLIYYSNASIIGKEDMFSYAVKHNNGSYVLWLMYINTRRQLNDRFVAYDAALSALHSHASMPVFDKTYASACILDLFLQMISCLCMSGNVDMAVQRICGLLPAATTYDYPHSLMLSDILTRLTFSDKCVFWVCCVYLVVYRKLPDAAIQGLELEKELFIIEWPLVDVIGDERQRILKMLAMGVESVELCTHDESSVNGVSLRSGQLFALSHIKCMVALGDLECCRNLLGKYVKMYPSCLELKLIAARMLQNEPEDTCFAGFEDILSNWPKEAVGRQCIWNQYAEYALRSGRYEFSKELMVRWYSSVWKVSYPENETAVAVGGDTCGSPKLASSNPDITVNKLDLMYGFLNLSLHSLLQNNHSVARLAIDQALKAAAPEHFMHCMREHAMFVLTDELRMNYDFPISLQLSLLNSYLDHARSFTEKEPLSWKFIDNIEKPRLRQLVSNLLIPISSEFSLVNQVLEAWYGSSLLPQKLSQPKDLVDFVEAVLDLAPSNYLLAITVCKQLSGEYSHTDVSSASILFWAGSTLVNTFSCAVPVPPEYIWVEAADTLSSIAGIEAIGERFHRKALSVYPFSVKLWKSYYNLSKSTGNMNIVAEAAREKGIGLD